MIPVLLLVALGGLMQAAGSVAPTGGATGTLLAFGYLLLAAYFAGRIVERVRLPRLTGYLLAGVASGPFALALVTPQMTARLSIVNSVATCILGLVAGAELDLRRVRPLLRTVRAVLLLAVIGSMFVLAALLYALRGALPMFGALDGTAAIAVCAVIGVALVPQSPAIVMALLAETRADGPLSQTMLAIVVMADLVVVILYSIVAAVASAMLGGGVDVVGTALGVAWELLGSIAFGAALGVLLGAAVRWAPDGAAMVALLVCVVVAEIGPILHLDPLIAMLVAGVWLQNVSRADAHPLVAQFESAQLPVFLVWFALAGMRLDLPQLWALALPVAAIAVVRGLALYAGARIACSRTGAAPVIRTWCGAGLLPQAGLTLALVAALQSSFPTFGGDAAVLLLSVLGINQLVPPVLLRVALVRAGEAGAKRAHDFAADG